MVEPDSSPDSDGDGGENGFAGVRRDGVLRVSRPGTEWLSSGWNGGRWETDAAYNVTVPDGWEETDLEAYVTARLERAGFDAAGPALFTGVDVAHARGARCRSVTAFATAGLSNPAALPTEPSGGDLPTEESAPASGTVNLIVGTTRALAPGALANLIAVAAEAKAATLLAETGFPGTTSDAIVAGHDPTGRPAAFSGSATPVGAAARACVREAVRTSLRSRYGSGSRGTGDADAPDELPTSLEDATYGVSTDVEATVFRPRTTID
ncbi:adenosylcobinamide amidohydrolase [Natrialbaceae archaeon GCM10025810]|uniref:adenosylcobinamide amidohydrolase n=1 Tax=Halovalidus salilacus TaxID=3075124 RepID=UPI0036106544